MPELEKINTIEIRSEEVQDVLGAAPRWIVRAGISVILAVVLALFAGSWFFKYPDMIQARIIITTQNPPVPLKANRTGKISELFFAENQTIAENDVVAIVENTANYTDYLYIESLFDTLTDINSFVPGTNLQLGELQNYYTAFLRLMKEYQNFKQFDYYAERINSIEQQITDYKIYYSRLLLQKNIQEKELAIVSKQYDRDKRLFEDSIYSESDFEKAEKSYLQEKLSFESSRTTLANTQMQINQLKQQILELKFQKTTEQTQKEIAIDEAIENFKGQLISWGKNYLIVSPISGVITFTRIWSRNQNVSAGEVVATVVPPENTDLLGRVELPAAGAGKVRPGQTVNIKLDNFPHIEFGLVKATVKHISLVPVTTQDGTFYTAEIEMPDSLVSNYGKDLQFSQEMTGVAEIITDDLSLFERFLNPVRTIINKGLE